MAMNPMHQELCSSADWADAIREQILPAVLDGVDLGADVLELGPGYGAATRVLAGHDIRLTSLEIDPEAVQRLTAEFGGSVTIVEGDGAAMPFPDASFSGAVCFTMLHHVPTVEVQDRLFAEVARVLRPGGRFAGSDSTASDGLRDFHEGDTYNPLEPDTLTGRLERAGFAEVVVTTGPGYLSFRAARP